MRLGINVVSKTVALAFGLVVFGVTFQDGDAAASIGVPDKIGAPVSATSADAAEYDEVGYAHCYGEELAGRKTASGEPFVPAAVTATHRTLPLPSYVEVTSLDNGRTILVRVNDRGPVSHKLLIDLSRGAAEQLEVKCGRPAVRVRRVNAPEQDQEALRSGKRAAERLPSPDILLAALRKKLPPETETAASATAASKVNEAKTLNPVIVKMTGTKKAENRAVNGTSYGVQVGAYSSRARAEQIAKQVGGAVTQAGKLWRVRIGPYQDEATAQHERDRVIASGFKGAPIVVND